MGFRRSSRSISRAVLLCGLAWCSTGLSQAQPAPARVAVVVNSSVAVDSVEFQELKSILLGERGFWEAGQRITIVMYKDEVWEREQVLKSMLGMTYGRYKFHWLAKINRDKALAAPIPAPSSEAALQMVQQIPGAVAFVDADSVTGDLKVLLIDGLPPGDDGYPL